LRVHGRSWRRGLAETADERFEFVGCLLPAPAGGLDVAPELLEFLERELLVVSQAAGVLRLNALFIGHEV
jgi:hypothetical protein